MNDTTKTIINCAVGVAINSIGKVLQDAGTLCTPESKQSEENKKYFSDMCRDCRAAIAWLQALDVGVQNGKK